MNPRPLCVPTVLVALLAGCGTAPTATGDPQSAFEPRSEPGSGQQFLARFVGDWAVEKTIHRRSGEAVVSEGECTQRLVHGGRFLESEFVFHSDGGDSTGTGVIGFDAESGRFTSFWYDARSTSVSVRQSDESFDGEEIRLVGRSVDPDQPARGSRTVTRFADDGTTLVHQQFVPGEGGERLLMVLVLTRK